jgi:DNA-binding CsgD family transcriptional regulator
MATAVPLRARAEVEFMITSLADDWFGFLDSRRGPVRATSEESPEIGPETPEIRRAGGCQTEWVPAGAPAAEPVFVGRTAELAAVRAVVERACGGQAGALLIQGDAGVGKTELVAQVVREAGDRVLAVRAAALPLSSMTVPYLPLRSALARLAVVSGDEPHGVFGGAMHAVPLAFDGWVSARCRDRPLVLAVDDVQWADPSTLDALMYLLSGPMDRRLAVLLTVRPGEVREGHGFNRWLADVRRFPGFQQQLTLGPFDRATTELQIGGLLGAPPHQSLVDDVVARTSGNAYLTRLLVAGLAPGSRRLPNALPADLEGALLASWHQLSGPARDLTKVIAVGGRRVGAGELATFVTGADPFVDVPRLLREAEAAAVLDPAPDGRYWFHHPLQAQVLERRIPDEERRSWHARFAAHIEALAGPGTADVELLAAIADHHHRAGHPAEAYAAARRAAHAAGAAGGVREQIRLLRRALDLREHAVHPPPRVQLLLEVKDAAARAGDHDSELDTLEELLAVTSDEADPLLRAELLVRRGLLRFAAGRAFLPLDDVERAVELSSREPDSWQHAYSLAEAAHIGIWAADPRATEFAERAIAVARHAGHPPALSWALTAGAMISCAAGRGDEGLALADEGRRVAIQAQDYWAYVAASSWEVNCIAPFTSEQGTEHISRRRRELQALGSPHFYVAWLAIDEAFGWVSQGRWDLAAEPLRIALGANPGGLADVKARLTAARLAALQGRTEEALAHMQRADELCDSSFFLPLESDAVRSEVLLAAGDPDGAFASALRGATLPGLPPTLCERLIPLAARSLAELVEDARAHGSDAEPLLERVEDLVLRFPAVISDRGPEQPVYVAQLAACTAWYAAELGRARRDPDNAAAWENVVQLAGAAVMPWDAAYAGLQAARAYLRGGPGHRQDAAESLRASHRLAEELAARPILDALNELATTARLALLDVEPAAHTSAAYHLSGLTPREREVLAHIVAGLTYGEIARALVVSEKTVSTHVSNMLHKYSATTRVELAQLATRQARPQQP